MTHQEASVSTTPSSQQNIQRCPIFGVSYCVSNIQEVVNYVLTNLKALSGQYICFSNVHTTVMAKENLEY